MLREIRPVKQHKNEFFRRWFEDDFFDLIVWYDERRKFSGFQLCYQKARDEHALTWLEGKGYDHHRIDSGERSVWETKSPVLAAALGFPREQIIENFIERSSGLEREVVEYVVQKIEAYD